MTSWSGSAAGARLKGARLSRGWSLRRMARETGVSHGTIRNSEMYVDCQYISTIYPILKALNMTLNYLMEGNDGKGKEEEEN